MNIELLNKDIQTVRRLAKHLASGMVPVNELRDFFQELNRSIDEQQNDKPKKRKVKKQSRKDHYKSKLL